MNLCINENEIDFYSVPHKVGFGPRVAKATLWVGGMQFLSGIIQFIAFIVYGRMLNPSEFAKYSVAIVCTSAVEAFTNFAINLIIIQDRRCEEGLVNTCWTIQIIRGVILFLVVYIFSPLITNFLKIPEASYVVRVTSVILVLSALKNPWIITYARNLDFSPIFFQRVIPDFVGALIGVIGVLKFHNVWGIVVGVITVSLMEVFLSFVLSKKIPAIVLSRADCKKVLSFGGWAMAGSILHYLNSRLDHIIISRFIGKTALGIYSYSQQIMERTISITSKVISTSSMPAFSRLQDDPTRLFYGWKRTVEIQSFILLPVVLILQATVRDFVFLVLKKEWEVMVSVVVILSFYSFLNVIMNLNIFIACGRINRAVYLAFLRFCFFVFLVFPFIKIMSLSGVAFAGVISQLSVLFFWCYELAKIVNFRMYDVFSLFLKIISLFLLFSVLVNIFRNFTQIGFVGLMLNILFVMLISTLFFLVFLKVNPHYIENIENLIRSLKKRNVN